MNATDWLRVVAGRSSYFHWTYLCCLIAFKHNYAAIVLFNFIFGNNLIYVHNLLSFVSRQQMFLEKRFIPEASIAMHAFSYFHMNLVMSTQR